MRDVLTYYAKRADYYDLMNNYYTRQTGEEVKFFESKFKKSHKKIKRILDAACGTGRFSIEFAKKGYNVVGIDLSKEMLRVAKRKSKNLTIDYKIADMRKFKSKNKFDCVMCPFSSILHLETEQEVIQTLKNFYQNLVKNGILIFDVWNYLGWARLKFDWDPTFRENGVVLKLHRHEWTNGITGFYHWKDTVTVIEKGKKKRFPIASKLKIWKHEEWLKFLKKSRFRKIKFYGDDRKHFYPNSERFYSIAIK
jgi:SAM-dependent methyltransferase